MPDRGSVAGIAVAQPALRLANGSVVRRTPRWLTQKLRRMFAALTKLSSHVDIYIDSH